MGVVRVTQTDSGPDWVRQDTREPVQDGWIQGMFADGIGTAVGAPSPVNDHEVTGVEYAPICDRCGRGAHLTEADDGTFEHD